MTDFEDRAHRGATTASVAGPGASTAGPGASAAGPGAPAAGPGAGTAGRRRWGRPRLSTVALAASILLGTALLLWGADWGARYAAESLLARTIQTATGVPTRPEVDVHGTFFLPQVVSGRYGDVEITVHGLTSGPLRIQTVHADLRGVHVPFHDVLVRDIGPVLVDSSQEEALLTYADLDHYLDATGRPVTIQAAPKGQAKLTGTVQVLGRDISASARATLSTRDGALLVSPTQLDTATGLDTASRLLLGQRFSFAVPLDPLPFGQELTGVQPQSGGIHVTARGQGVVVRP